MFPGPPTGLLTVESIHAVFVDFLKSLFPSPCHSVITKMYNTVLDSVVHILESYSLS